MCKDSMEFPTSCFVFVPAAPGRRIGVVTRGQPGVLFTGIDRRDMVDAEARMLVNTLNSARGVTPDTAERMLALSVVVEQEACNHGRLAA